MKTLKHKNTYVNVGEKGRFFLSCEQTDRECYEHGYINTNLMLNANYEAEYDGLMVMPTDDFFTFKDMQETQNGMELRFQMPNGLEISEKVEFIDGVNVFKQTTAVKNTGAESVRLSRLSAAMATGIGLGGSKWHENPDRFIVHTCYSRWQGEGQWQSRKLKDLGLYPTTNHVWERSVFRLQSHGSWSTNELYPLMIIEDTEKGECWFFEREGAENWYMEIMVFGGFKSEFINVSMGGADEALQWTYDLQSGERYETTAAVYGVVKGGFEEAVCALTAYKRKSSLANLSEIPVTFNDYMNCNWAIETEERLKPLIDKAAELGVEYFCIDDGWAEQGVWTPLDENFPSGGLQGLLDYMQAKGLKPGVWFEFERTTFEQAEKEGLALLKRNGKVVAHHRPKLDMRDRKVWEFLFRRIDEAYRMGVRFIKNDDNNDERIGTNYDGESPAEGTRRNTQAFYAFIDELRARYPDMIVENCGGGAMRQDHGTLSHFYLQSTSDQEDYRAYPSILIGAMAYLAPEKAGIWAYPYPLLFKDMVSGNVPQAEIDEYADGRQTVFNMVNAMCGYMYLSGKLHLANERNTALIKEGIEAYKTYKDDVKNRMPMFPLPMKTMDDKTYNAFGLKGKNDALLFVWALDEKEFVLDLQKYGYLSAEKFYPLQLENVAYTYQDGKLSLRFNEANSAAIFRLK